MPRGKEKGRGGKKGQKSLCLTRKQRGAKRRKEGSAEAWWDAVRSAWELASHFFGLSMGFPDNDLMRRLNTGSCTLVHIHSSYGGEPPSNQEFAADLTPGFGLNAVYALGMSDARLGAHIGSTTQLNLRRLFYKGCVGDKLWGNGKPGS